MRGPRRPQGQLASGRPKFDDALGEEEEATEPEDKELDHNPSAGVSNGNDDGPCNALDNNDNADDQPQPPTIHDIEH